MSKIKVSELAIFDMAEELKNDEDIIMYPSMVLADGDTTELNHALGIVARAKGIPFELRARQPNELTAAAIQELADGSGHRSISVDALLSDLAKGEG